MTEQELEAQPGSVIKSSCGISISLDRPTLDCMFGEKNYSGTLHIDATDLEKNKIGTIAPTMGTSKTIFKISAGSHAGYGSFVVSDASGNQLRIGLLRLEAVSKVVCAHPETSSQQVALPSTGDVSGTISFHAFKAAAGGCDYVKISTGADVEISATLKRFAQDVGVDRSEAASPLLTISVGEGLDGRPVFGYSTIVSGLQLMVSRDLNFPDGTYYATITTTSGQRSAFNGVIPFTAKNGVLTVASVTLPNGKQFPLLFNARTSSIIALYPRDVMPPDPTPSPSPSTSPTPTTSASPTPKPTPLPTLPGSRGASGKPPPAVGDIIGTYSWVWPSPPCRGVPYGCSEIDTPLGQETTTYGAAGLLGIPTGFSGTIKYDASKITYMELYPPVTNNCPRDWTVIAAIDGTGTIDVPKHDPYVGQPCTIIYSTQPPRRKNRPYYTEPIIIEPG